MITTLFSPVNLSIAVLCAISSLMSGQSSAINLTENTDIPSRVLKPGLYKISIVDSLDDRYIVRVEYPNSTEHQLFLGVVGSPHPAGVVDWEKGIDGNHAIREVSFENGPVVEFVYPKADAAKLAQKNKSHIVAVDYASANIVHTDRLTADQIRVVDLWTLSFTKTGPEDQTPAILAQRYEPPSTQVTTPNLGVAQVAQLHLPAQPAASPTPPALRPVKHLATIRTLPHTGSQLPLVWLLGALSIVGALSLQFSSNKRGSAGS
ncbi:hypothetical protein [Granulicella tundricola]|uniref:LPXTG-motif cell wall anchor domain protein n=1 Tax=Granulicella tundricola (strain ATCC BAA-1859 / DSM 23138 / MP5ACTX9) TaxID=1198114 RepID=E8X194_GRATM|nr:hypothetical protein [Granulicella tundricola]ADW69048.1 hypothetical protein AciX9_2003 [Granulicella tundricola MP5ACTX9]